MSKRLSIRDETDIKTWREGIKQKGGVNKQTRTACIKDSTG